MPKTITGKELNAQLDRLATETRQLMRRIKALRDASTETDNEKAAFFTLLTVKLKDADADEKEIFASLTKAPAGDTNAAAALTEEPEEPTDEER